MEKDSFTRLAGYKQRRIMAPTTKSRGIYLQTIYPQSNLSTPKERTFQLHVVPMASTLGQRASLSRPWLRPTPSTAPYHRSDASSSLSCLRCFPFITLLPYQLNMPSESNLKIDQLWNSFICAQVIRCILEQSRTRGLHHVDADRNALFSTGKQLAIDGPARIATTTATQHSTSRKQHMLGC